MRNPNLLGCSDIALVPLVSTGIFILGYILAANNLAHLIPMVGAPAGFLVYKRLSRNK